MQNDDEQKLPSSLSGYSRAGSPMRTGTTKSMEIKSLWPSCLIARSS